MAAGRDAQGRFARRPPHSRPVNIYEYVSNLSGPATVNSIKDKAVRQALVAMKVRDLELALQLLTTAAERIGRLAKAKE